jgi:hypothetical protein
VPDAGRDAHLYRHAHSQPDRNRDGWSDGDSDFYSDSVTHHPNGDATTGMDTDAVDNPPHLDSDPNRYVNVNRSPTHPDAEPVGLTLGHRVDGTLAERQPHALPDLRDLRDSLSEPELVGKPGDALIVTYGDAGAHRFVVVDAHGRWIGHGVLSGLDFHVDSLSRGTRVLPLRSDPDPDADPLAVPESHVHAHRHAHHAVAGDFLARTGLVVERYDHTHTHSHSTRGNQRVPDDRQYHTDHEH